MSKRKFACPLCRLCGGLKEKRWLLPAVLYALAWLAALAAALGLLLTDAADRKNGVLAAEELQHCMGWKFCSLILMKKVIIVPVLLLSQIKKFI